MPCTSEVIIAGEEVIRSLLKESRGCPQPGSAL